MGKCIWRGAILNAIAPLQQQRAQPTIFACVNVLKFYKNKKYELFYIIFFSQYTTSNILIPTDRLYLDRIGRNVEALYTPLCRFA